MEARVVALSQVQCKWLVLPEFTQQVNELFGRGSGNAWSAHSTDPGATNQAKVNKAANAVWADAGPVPFDFTGTYSIAPSSGSATVVFDAVRTPLPKCASAGLALFGAIGALHSASFTVFTST
jgi:hypothetical protein